jgi:hypothetical protein
MTDLLLPLLGGLVRSLIIAFGAWLGTQGITVTGSMEDQLVGAAMIVAGVGLSFMSKLWAKWKARAGAVAAARASAEATMKAGTPTPVTVTVTPVGMPNRAVKVSSVESSGIQLPPAGIPPAPAPAA